MKLAVFLQGAEKPFFELNSAVVPRVDDSIRVAGTKGDVKEYTVVAVAFSTAVGAREMTLVRLDVKPTARMRPSLV